MYEEEIKMMMYSFGDSRTPKTSTSRYIEDLVRNYAKRLISRSRSIQRLRRSSVLDIEDVCFVLRRDRERVFRILQNIDMKMYRFDVSDEETLVGGEEVHTTEFDWFDRSSCKGLSARLKSLDEYTSRMGADEYAEYSKCREASFTYRKMKKFKTFLGITKVRDGVVDVLGLICHEMVFDLVDTGLRIREERCRRGIGSRSVSMEYTQPLDVGDVEEGARRMLMRGRPAFRRE